MRLPHIYLAGPDVFFTDVGSRFDRLRMLCQQRGLIGVSPLDGEVGGAELPQNNRSLTIYQTNVSKIDAAHGLLANLSPFRSATEPDCGTAFEVGYAAARGIAVAAWLPDAAAPYLARIQAAYGPLRATSGEFRCPPDDSLVEDFGQPLNLMLAHGARIFRTPEQALDDLAARLGASPT